MEEKSAIAVIIKRWMNNKRQRAELEKLAELSNPPVKIILNDYIEFPLLRKKKIFERTFKCGIGRFLKNISRRKSGVEFSVILVINTTGSAADEAKKKKYIALESRYKFIDKVIFRNNAGFDFGAYNEGHEYLKKRGHHGDVLFVNSSVRGPFEDYWLLKYSALFRKHKNTGLCGISLNSHSTHLDVKEFTPHVQSFFLYTSMGALGRVFKGALPAYNIEPQNPREIISEGEIEFSRKILDAGYGISCSLFDDFIYYQHGEWEIPCGDIRFTHQYNYFANRI